MVRVPEPRITLQTLKVLDAFITDPSVPLSGTELMERCGLASGTLYPILIRLDAAGWLTSRWENIDPVQAGRPRRRLYRLGAPGRKAYEAATSSLQGRTIV